MWLHGFVLTVLQHGTVIDGNAALYLDTYNGENVFVILASAVAVGVLCVFLCTCRSNQKQRVTGKPLSGQLSMTSVSHQYEDMGGYVNEHVRITNVPSTRNTYEPVGVDRPNAQGSDDYLQPKHVYQHEYFDMQGAVQGNTSSATSGLYDPVEYSNQNKT